LYRYTKKAQYRMSSCDTSVVFMQTKAAAASGAHRVTGEAMAAMRLAFRPRMTSTRRK
jgi:hypothetical protein